MSGTHDLSKLRRITKSARDGRLTAQQMRELREIISELEARDPEGEALKRSIYNAKVFDTQLRVILDRLDDRTFTPEEFAKLPPYLQARLKTRFKNIAERFEVTVKAMETGGSGTKVPIFKCKDELDACLKDAPGGMNRMWCQIAMATCLAATAYKMAFGN